MQSCPCIKHRGALIPKSTKRRCKQPLMEEKEGPLMEEKEGPLMEEEEDPLMEAARHFSCEMLDQVVRGSNEDHFFVLFELFFQLFLIF